MLATREAVPVLKVYILVVGKKNEKVNNNNNQITTDVGKCFQESKPNDRKY